MIVFCILSGPSLSPTERNRYFAALILFCSCCSPDGIDILQYGYSVLQAVVVGLLEVISLLTECHSLHPTVECCH